MFLRVGGKACCSTADRNPTKTWICQRVWKLAENFFGFFVYGVGVKLQGHSSDVQNQGMRTLRVVFSWKRGQFLQELSDHHGHVLKVEQSLSSYNCCNYGTLVKERHYIMLTGKNSNHRKKHKIKSKKPYPPLGNQHKQLLYILLDLLM